MAQLAHLFVATALSTRSVYPVQRAIQLRATSDGEVTVLYVLAAAPCDVLVARD
jgi:hypothetical protein